MTQPSFPGKDIAQDSREARLPKRAFAVWFVGLPCAGKTTLAKALHESLKTHNVKTQMLDGDELRKTLNADLGYSVEDRTENIRRAAEASKLLVDAGTITLNCFITPTKALRQMAKNIVGNDRFIQVFVKCPLDICERRDVKGLYKKARRGEIADFTGVSAPFEAPVDADVTVDTSVLNVEACVVKLLDVVLPGAIASC